MSKIRSLLIFFLVSAILGCAEVNDSQPTSEVSMGEQDGIIGGHSVNYGDPEARSVVMVFNYQLGEVCTGVLIHPRAVLTAAHCVDGDTQFTKIYFSLDPFGSDSEVEDREIKKKLIHPRYQKEKLMLSIDLAILFLGESAPQGYQPEKVFNNADLMVNQVVALAGFGLSSIQNLSQIGVLKKVDALISRIYGNFIEVDQSKGRGICGGDSGGPLFLKQGSDLVLVGIAKLDYDRYKNGAQDCHGTSQFTSLKSDSIRLWIKNSLANLGIQP